MSYYTGRGDYYSGKGDPGFASILGGILGTAGKVASAVLPGVGSAINVATSVASKALSGGGSTTKTSLNVPSVPAIPTPGLTGLAQRLVPGGASGYSCGGGNPCESGYHLDKTNHEKCVRNRRTNYTNPRALARAAKRMDGFVGVARKALKTTNYKVVAKSFRANYRKPLKR